MTSPRAPAAGRGVVSADVGGNYVDARQLADLAHIEFRAIGMAASRRIVEADLILLDMAEDAAL